LRAASLAHLILLDFMLSSCLSVVRRETWIVQSDISKSWNSCCGAFWVGMPCSDVLGYQHFEVTCGWCWITLTLLKLLKPLTA
jgi:hypothetical protein